MVLILKRQTAQNIIEIGKRPIEAKKMVGHGNWLAYLREQVQFSERTARNFMRAAEEFSNRQALADLEPSKVYLLLEAPEEVRDDLAAKAADMTKRELEEAVREANRLRKEAEEAKRRAEAAEARAKELENRPPQIVERTVVKEVKSVFELVHHDRNPPPSGGQGRDLACETPLPQNLIPESRA